MKKILFTALFLALLPFGAFAAERPPRFIDEVGLLTEAQASELTRKLDEISERHRFDTVAAVVPSLDDREARLFAIDFFEEHGFGYGENLDGAILLLAVEERDYGFAGYGFALEAFTDAGQRYLEKLFLPHLREDDYYEAFLAFADGVDDFVAKAKRGEPYDVGNIPLTPGEVVTARLIAGGAAILLPLITALVILTVWKRQLTSVRKDDFARAYLREGSMVLTSRRDDFLYSHVNRTRRAETSGGGGSFRSSSGRSSTGRSGKY
ncbi:MAG: TPM domain-containing protein [Oscillospiraceae bacterium]|jgi:uncharacterized protein|nr:TPM domain-containing protein [Oscillospiraceae bacterium]